MDLADAQCRLVINADGFGATRTISRGILKAHQEGVVTSTSIHGNTAGTTEDIVNDLRQHPELGVGVQLVLLTGQPLSPREKVPSLLGSHGALIGSPGEFIMRWARSRIVPAELELEMSAQVQRFVDAGLALDHLDTYLHLAFFPIVAEAMERVAQRFGIRALRTQIEEPNLTWFTDLDRGLPLAALGALALLSRGRLGGLHRHGAKSWGYAESGNLGRMRILEILGRLGPGIHELICHPGEVDEAELTLTGRWRPFARRTELEALTSPMVRDAIKRRGIAPCRFRDLF